MTSCVSKEFLPQSKVVKEPGNNKEFKLLLLQNKVFNCVKEVTSKVLSLIRLELQTREVKRGVCWIISGIDKEGLNSHNKEVNEGGNNKDVKIFLEHTSVFKSLAEVRSKEVKILLLQMRETKRGRRGIEVKVLNPQFKKEREEGRIKRVK